MTREEALIAYRKIRFLSEVLQKVYPHKAWIEKLGKYDPTFDAVDMMTKQIHGCRSDLRSVPPITSNRASLKLTTEGLVQSMFKTSTGRDRSLSFSIGGKPKASRHQGEYSRIWGFQVTVGWMWEKKVWNTLYLKCAHHYAEYFILSAEKVRVNSKHIELYEVKAFHRGTGDTVNGYVAKTKSPRQSCEFSQTAHQAVRNAEIELQSELNLLLKGTSND